MLLYFDLTPHSGFKNSGIISVVAAFSFDFTLNILLHQNKPKQSMLLRKVIAVYAMNYRKHINTLCQ
jgi:hypothetical protein